MASKRGEDDEVVVVVHGSQPPLQEEDYIDMDLTSAPATREFEFHMSAPLHRSGEPLASPADELFYKGKLLPLHLPPRVQMLEEELLDGVRGGSRLLAVSTAPATPCDSELNVEEFFRECYALSGLMTDVDGGTKKKKKTWSRKLRFMRLQQLNLGLKLKASKAYLKTMFTTTTRPGNAAEDDDKTVVVPAAASTRGGANEPPSHGGHLRQPWRKSPFSQTKRSNKCIASQNSGVGHGSLDGHRRSFSNVIVRYSPSNRTSPAPPPSSSCSSSSKSSASSSSSVRTSNDSDGGAGSTALRRSSSASSEAENPIQGLIAYCKKSQQLASVRKSASDAGFRFLSSSAASKIAAESDELVEIFRA